MENGERRFDTQVKMASSTRWMANISLCDPEISLPFSASNFQFYIHFSTANILSILPPCTVLHLPQDWPQFSVIFLIGPVEWAQWLVKLDVPSSSNWRHGSRD